MATEPAYRLNWKLGEDKMLIVSLGTGSAPVLGNDAEDPESNLAAAAANTLSAIMAQAQVDQDMNCRTIGRCSHGDILDGEVGDLITRFHNGERIPLEQDQGRSFLYLRYNAELTREGLDKLGLTDVDPKEVSKLDSTDGMPDLKRIGDEVARKIHLEDFGSFV